MSNTALYQPSDFVAIFAPVPTMVVLLVLNLLLPVTAILLGRKSPWARPLFHLIALGFIAASPNLFIRLGLAPADQELSGFGDDFLLLPFLLEGFLIVLAYIIYALFKIGGIVGKLVIGWKWHQ